MPHYADLQDCDFFGSTGGKLVAIGWLARGHPFAKGAVNIDFFEALAALAVDPWQPFATAGVHGCDFCKFTGGPTELTLGELRVPMGCANLFVPTPACVFVTPSLVLHYLDAHEYAPPQVFLRAVEGCPPMRSMEYLKAIRSHGIQRLARSRAW